MRNFNANDIKTFHKEKIYVVYVYGGIEYEDEIFEEEYKYMHQLADQY